MRHFSLKMGVVLLAAALVIWASCGAVMFAGMALLPLDAALIVHAIAAPLIATAVTYLYYTRVEDTPPLLTAFCFTAVVILMDVLVVAMLIERSFAMFASILGTWLPFALIFSATYVTGRRLEASGRVVAAG